MTTITEFEQGTDPHDADSDDDTLTDWQELAVVQMDPLVPDSNAAATDANESDNGTIDGVEDLDGDGLTNDQEFINGSSPLYADGDADGLDDPHEYELGTDPMKPDTDADFLDDAIELQEPFTADPLDPDTDDDTIVDGNETYTAETTNASLNVSIAVTDEGNGASGVTVRNQPSPGLRNNFTGPARAGEFIRYHGVASAENATIRFQYDEAVLPTNESDLAIYRFDPASGRTARLNTTVDARNDTVSAPLENDSGIATVFSPSVLRERFADPADPDSDGDGYWDGWIGVDDVGQTENVVLYREQLLDDDNNDRNFTNDGLQGNEVEPAGATNECAACGVETAKPLWVREHSCPACGFTADRDWNAAYNILVRGLKQVGTGCSESTPAETALPTGTTSVPAKRVVETGSPTLKKRTASAVTE